MSRPVVTSRRRGPARQAARQRSRALLRGLPAVLILLVLGPLGCVEQDAAQVPALDADRYADEVQPFMAASCATLDCHGDGGRPLRLYAELGLRREDSLRPRPVDTDTEPAPLQAEELAANIAAFAALTPGLSAGGEELLLSKPLAVGAGGGAHVGGDLFGDRQHPGYLCLRRWLHGLGADAGSCVEALAALPDPAP